MGKVVAGHFAFNRGIVSPLAMGRIDLERMAISAEIQRNWMPRSLGPMMLRPGLKFITGTHSSAAVLARYLPFVFSTDDVALIEMSAGAVRVLVDDAVVGFEAVSMAVTNGGFESDLTGWTDADDAGAESTWTDGSVNYVSLTGQTIHDVDTLGAGIIKAEYQVNSNGVAYTLRNRVDAGVPQVIAGEWLEFGVGADYEVFATLDSGILGLASAATGVWLSCDTTRKWNVVNSGLGTNAAQITVKIRKVGTTTDLDTAVIELEAESTP